MIALETDLAIEVKNASVVYQTADSPVHALSHIDLSVAAGEFVSLIGPSGCGKTTLVRVIADPSASDDDFAALLMSWNPRSDGYTDHAVSTQRR